MRVSALRVLVLPVVVTALVSAARTSVTRPQETSSRANVLLVTIDTLRADKVGAYGARSPSTPTMDALAAQGVLFEHTTVQVPLTRPAHVSILTGTGRR